MPSNRRHFLRGAWLRPIERLPTPEGTFEIASVIVHARPEDLDEVAEAIIGLSGHEVAARDPRGKLIVLVESGPGDRLGDSLTMLSTMEKVLSATLVYHAVDTSPVAANAEAV